MSWWELVVLRPRAVLTTVGYPGIPEVLALDAGHEEDLLSRETLIQTWKQKAVWRWGCSSHKLWPAGSQGTISPHLLEVHSSVCIRTWRKGNLEPGVLLLTSGPRRFLLGTVLCI